jgi:hypothetical protein
MLPLTNCAFNKNGDKYFRSLFLDLSQEVMIVHVKYGIHLQEKN